MSLIAPSLTFAFDGTHQASRYAKAYPSAKAVQVDPLSSIVKIKFPNDVQTIKQAIEYLLGPTGYRLAPVEFSDPYVKNVFISELADIHREIGLIRVDDAIKTIVGKPWELVEDPVNRMVTLELKNGYRQHYNEGQY